MSDTARDPEQTTEPAGPPLARFTAPIDQLVMRDTKESGNGDLVIKGHAAVFNLLSHDLGGFREQIAPNAFAEVLASDPDVHFDWDHDTRYVLSRTRNNSLELSEDERGLRVYAKVAPTSYAADLAVLLDGGFIDQMSFKFTIDSEEWTEDSDGNLTSTILRVGDLYDVTVTAQGAYPQTDAQLVRQRLERAVADGRVPSVGRAGSSVADLRGPGAKTDPIAASEEPGGSASSTGADFERAKRQRELDLARAITP